MICLWLIIVSVALQTDGSPIMSIIGISGEIPLRWNGETSPFTRR